MTNTKNKSSNWIIHTDGSKTTTGVGAGIIITNNKGKHVYQASLKMAPHCTITQAELWAVNRSLAYIETNMNNSKETIEVNVDSRVELHTLNNQRKNSTLAKETIQLAQKIAGTNNLTIQWIKAHGGHEGNERADKLAKKAETTDSKIT
ncbi:uncharacterized protein LOC111615765, partial [Centruroides sculpturatus]|uniref:uncharacterized protein LOC111615765 n=1 Tax=Centruroides sculpturatus TaxID=218467 RepID=UPI000C6DB0EB